MTALQQYAANYIRQRAHAEVCDALKPKAIKELERIGGKTDIRGVELHLSTSTLKEYPEAVKHAIASLKRAADDDGSVLITSKQTMVATIPRSAAKQILGRVAAYTKQFKIKKRS